MVEWVGLVLADLAILVSVWTALRQQTVQNRMAEIEEARRSEEVAARAEADLTAFFEPRTTSQGKRGRRLIVKNRGLAAKKVEKRDARIKELEGQDGNADTGALRSTRLELAFLKVAIEREEPIGDLDTAWDLANVRGFLDAVEIEEDGAASGMAEALDRIADRYPWLVDDDALPGDDDAPPSRPGGRPVTPKRHRGTETRAGLEKRFPALRRRRWVGRRPISG
jgi:hypothetical protein